MVTEEEKHCWRCDEWKPITDFYRNKNAKDNRQSRCKKCDHAVHCEYSQRERPRFNQYKKTWREKRIKRLSETTSAEPVNQ